MRFFPVLAALMLLSGCVSATARTAPANPVAVPNSGLRVVPLSIRTATGAHNYSVEVAATPAEQAKGMMFRRSMPRGRGMIFPMQPPRPASFWMQNTWLPLDIIFIAPGGRVLNVVRGEPLSLAMLDSAGPVEAVLELNAGEAERIRLKPGDPVRWQGSRVDGRRAGR
jgi:uncharacterized membrane protein (UPF0127 family)